MFGYSNPTGPSGSSSLRKKVKQLRQKFCKKEEGPSSGFYHNRAWKSLPGPDGFGGDMVTPGAPKPSRAMMTSPIITGPIVDRDSVIISPECAATLAADNAAIDAAADAYERNRAKTSEIQEGHALRAGNANGKNVARNTAAPEIVGLDGFGEKDAGKTVQPKEKEKEKESKSKKYNMNGRIRVKPSTRSNSFSDASIDSGPGSIVDANVVFRKWPDEELALQREVIENYAAGKKLWTKGSLMEMERRLEHDNLVHLDAYAGIGDIFEKQEGSAATPSSLYFSYRDSVGLTDAVPTDNRLTYRAEFHGYAALAHPPPSRPNGKPYCSLSLRVAPFDYSRVKVHKEELDTFHHYTAYWLGHPLGRLFAALFSKVPLPARIDKIVCIDLGSITVRDANEHGYVRRAIYKHAAAMSAVEAIHRRFGSRVQLVVQDTDYCAECVDVLYAKGFTVVGEHGAQGLAEVDENTLVFAPNPTFCVKEVVADIAEPAAMFWGTVRSPEEQEAWTQSVEPVGLDDKLVSYYHEHETDPDTPRVRDLIQKYDRHPFPTNNLFGAVSLYTRKDEARTSVTGISKAEAH